MRAIALAILLGAWIIETSIAKRPEMSDSEAQIGLVLIGAFVFCLIVGA